MNLIRKRLLWVGLIIVFGIVPYRAEALDGITITTPQAGTTVSPGQVVPITVAPLGGFALSKVLIVTRVGVQTADKPPFTVNLAIPQHTVGPLEISVAGKDSSGTIVSSNVTITVQSAAPLQSLQAVPPQFYFVSLGAQRQLSVSGMYTDEMTRDLTDSQLGTTYHSNNVTVVTVDSDGVMTARGNGTAMVTIANEGQQTTVPVIVTVRHTDCAPEGDVNQDGQMTPADALLAFRQFLGTATLPLDACQQGRADVTRDGHITPADARCIFQKFLGLASCLD